MDFALSDELAELKERTERFVQEQILPYEMDKRQTAHGPSEELRRELVGLGRGLGHHEARADLAGGERSQPLFLLALLGDLFEEVHIGLVGRKAIQCRGPERRIAGRLEDDRLRPVIEPEAAPIAADMRAEQPRPAPEPDELPPQLLARSVRRLPLVHLIGQDLLLHEALSALLQRYKFV